MVVKPTTPISYELPLGEQTIPLNPYLGQKIGLRFLDKFQCMGCHKPIKKTYQDGYCFPCTQTLARCDLCIIKPERCHYHLGTCREPQWGQSYCMISHTVYLANTTGIKVGITRGTQIPTRWIDQGAIEAQPLFEVANRRLSGLIEIALAKHVKDKSNWRQLLMGTQFDVNFAEERVQLLPKLQQDLNEIAKTFPADSIRLIESPPHHRFEYPVLAFPKKVNSLGFDKQPMIEGTLQGIKGQYLIFDIGVLNIRKHSGYLVEFIA